MASAFNNYNSSIGNQVIGTLNVNKSEDDLALIKQQLNFIVEKLKSEPQSSAENMVLIAVEELRAELAGKSPKVQTLEKSLRAIERVSAYASLVGQIRSLMISLF